MVLISFKEITYKNGKKKYNIILWERNEYEQVYLVRNVLFEPSASQSINWVDKALSQINRAFSQKQPAIICSHRVNFIGRIFKENRDKNLFLFRQCIIGFS